MNPEPTNRSEALDALTAESQKLGLYDLDVTLLEGKYRIVANSDMSGFRALRYGKEWRDLCGDKLVLALAHEVTNLRNTLDKIIDTSSSHLDVLHGPKMDGPRNDTERVLCHIDQMCVNALNGDFHL